MDIDANEAISQGATSIDANVELSFPLSAALTESLRAAEGISPLFFALTLDVVDTGAGAESSPSRNNLLLFLDPFWCSESSASDSLVSEKMGDSERAFAFAIFLSVVVRIR